MVILIQTTTVSKRYDLWVPVLPCVFCFYHSSEGLSLESSDLPCSRLRMFTALYLFPYILKLSEAEPKVLISFFTTSSTQGGPSVNEALFIFISLFL